MHNADVNLAQFIPDGQKIVSASQNGVAWPNTV
jgi:hypothetical protein